MKNIEISESEKKNDIENALKKYEVEDLAEIEKFVIEAVKFYKKSEN